MLSHLHTLSLGEIVPAKERGKEGRKFITFGRKGEDFQYVAPQNDYVFTLPDYPINGIDSQYDANYMPQIFQQMSCDIFDDYTVTSRYQSCEQMMPHR